MVKTKKIVNLQSFCGLNFMFAFISNNLKQYS